MPPPAPCRGVRPPAALQVAVQQQHLDLRHWTSCRGCVAAVPPGTSTAVMQPAFTGSRDPGQPRLVHRRDAEVQALTAVCRALPLAAPAGDAAHHPPDLPAADEPTESARAQDIHALQTQLDATRVRSLLLLVMGSAAAALRSMDCRLM
jgi:hypothetical protein